MIRALLIGRNVDKDQKDNGVKPTKQKPKNPNPREEKISVWERKSEAEYSKTLTLEVRRF